ncbi:GNAT family N-acetyltransferase [Pseudomonas petrae]|uniref:GNAT family N-acetyltransferase n=1 Tax=Pseudomonas petrae TaxID=2912190 RepID=A0ABS9I2N5_9PSED|nr:GNAT family N-acetyltransferase [Pseudomonas petrae]MCF7531231.1 GNAT family N-acetyltransferase [Pseudomonas petrae]MCF7540069.1 GNAT family N-acetyltransferase [Pseudomonas petrae]MCF7542034.1 GNAT family N-acetyltransferase [Pseudomonas petrae]MCF7554601.1 GNAT family N-acetyltransferase [Pseudomonas petrae]
MRRDLGPDLDDPGWPAAVRPVEFTAQNASAVHQLLMLGREYGGGRVADYATWLEAFETDPEFDQALCFVLEDAQGVVAVAQCWTSAFIRNLVVHPRAHRQGLGLALLSQAFAAFRQRSEGHIDLKVMESNLRARRLYERAGMQYIQRHELEPR